MVAIILGHERSSGRNAAEPDLQRELIAVISKYIKINLDAGVTLRCWKSR